MGIKESIKAASRRTKLVPTPECPEADGKIHLRKLTVNERKFLAEDDRASGDRFWREFLALAVVEADGSQAFLSADEVEAVLGGADTELVEHLVDEAREFCLPTRKLREAMGKNSEQSRSGDSPSGSAENSESFIPTPSEISSPPNNSTSGTSTA